MIGDLFGRYSGASRASKSQQAVTTSTIILKAKALVVIKGKKNELETKKGTNGSRKSPAIATNRSVCLFIWGIY